MAVLAFRRLFLLVKILLTMDIHLCNILNFRETPRINCFEIPVSLDSHTLEKKVLASSTVLMLFSTE